jgi:hypothetical protein
MWKEKLFQGFKSKPLDSSKFIRNSNILFDFSRNPESKKK